MLDAIRRRSGSIAVKILLGLLILSFGLWGVNDVFFTRAQNAAAVTVGDTEVLGAEVEQAVRREIARLQQLVPGLDFAQAQSMGIVDSVVDQIVTRNLYTQAARDLGLTVSDPLIRTTISENPAFQGPGGTFDRFAYQQTLQANSLSEEAYVAQLRGDIIRSQLVESVTDVTTAPMAMAEAIYRYHNERRVAETVFIRDADMETPPDPGDEVLKAFHQDNAAQFTAPEYRKVVAVVLTADDLAKEIAVSEAELEEAFESRRHQFSTPELRTVRQMVLSSKEEAEKAAAMLAEGRAFEAVAKDLTGADPESLELGEMTREDMLPEMADAAFAVEKGAHSPPVESPLGWHIIQVTEIKEGSEPTLADVRDDLSAELARERAIDSLYDLSNDLQDALAGGASLEEAARQLDVPLVAIEAVDATGRNPQREAVADLPPTGRFLDVAFQTAEGEESPLEEGGTDSYFVLRVDKVTPPALRPFETVRDEVLAAWQTEQRKQAAEARANALLDKVIGGGELAAIAEEAGLTVETTQPLRRTAEGSGPPQALRDVLFTGTEGAYAVARGNGGSYLARVKEIVPVDPSADRASIENLARQLGNGMRNDIGRQLAGGLRGEYSVNVNQKVLDELF